MGGYIFRQEKLVMAAGLLPWAVSQACTVLEEFEYPYLAEWLSWVCVQRQNVCDKWPLVFSN